ncbi:MAG TPA: hypothetical protein VD905_00680, partial [Flavobacteriales bacterium]|nr:hypothetical protein [Flavobacteriales bacterium]
MTNFTARLSFIAAFLLCSVFSQAAKLTFVKSMSAPTGSQIVVNDKDSVEATPKSNPGFTDIALSNYLGLFVDQNSHVLVSSNQTTVVIVQVTPYDTNDVAQTPFNETLSVAYNPTLGSATFTDRHTKKLSTSWYKFVFKITSIKVNGSNAPLPRYLTLEGKIEVERIYHFGSVVNTLLDMNTIGERNLDCDGGGIIDEVEISWEPFAGTVQADEYQLEWTFINDYDTGVISNTKLLDEIKFDFKNNSTRITTTNTYYYIPLLFDRGYLIYRVRAVGYDTLDPTIPMYSDWNVVDADTLNNITSDNYYYIDTPHEAGKNWQVTTTFAEEGKKKEVVSYFDGSLRNRQTVTRINSDNKTIVGETIYDYQGRPAVTVLPVPVPDFSCLGSFSTSVIRYFPNFNVDSNGVAYSKLNFDVDDTSGTCSVLAPPMYDSVGASNYYSVENVNKTREQAFVPDAKGYPFTQVEYTNDNTGRIRRQGGVGEEFQLGSGHETGYLYGQPNQIQLDRLFGSEVGDASHYKKNVVIDPNGQASVSYLDQEGRVIATALAGDTTSNLHALESSRDSAVLTVDLFNKDANGNSNSNTINAGNNGIEFHTELLVTYQSNYEFDYGIEIDTLMDTCFKEDICINCVYNLQIQVLDECGVDMVQAEGDTINGLIGHFELDGDDLDFVTTCHSPSTYDTATNFTLSLDPGVYTVVKKLSLNLAWRDSVVAAYIDTAYNHCVLTLQDFIDAQMAGIDTSGCHIDCDECVASLGTRDDFVASGKGTALQYDVLLEQCEAPCKQHTLCENTYQQMLMDVTPGGQYAGWNIIGGAYSVYSFPLSILNDANLLSENHHPGPAVSIWDRAWWRNPATVINGTEYPFYFEENGDLAKIYLSTDVDGNYVPDVYIDDSIKTDANGSYVYPQHLAQLKDFINAFKPSWAKGLVTYHPEYCYYRTCSEYAELPTATDVLTSEDFDAMLRACETFQQAIDTGLIDNVTKLPTDWFTFSSTDPYDPFVVRDHGSYGTTLENKFDNYVYFTGGSYSMTQQAAIMARCGYLTGIVPDTACDNFGTDHIPGDVTHNTEIRNKEWGYLRDWYLSEKQQLQTQRADSIAMYDCYAFNDCIGNDEVWSYMYPMSIASNGSGTPAFQNLSQPCSYGYDQLYASKQKRFPDINDIPGVSAGDNDPMTTAYQQYLVTGQCPLATAVQNMLSTIADSSFLLNDTIDLMHFPMFNPVYMALSNFQPVAPISQYNYLWLADTTGWGDEDTLHVDMISDNDTCYFIFDKTGTTLAWEDILGFSGMAEGPDFPTTPPSYGFTINAHIAPDAGSYHPYELVEITGRTSCWNMDKCDFPLTCTPTTLGYNLYTIMNVLATEENLTGSGVALDTDLYDSLMIPAVYYTMGYTTNTGLDWTYTAADSAFNIFHPSTPANRIRLKITGHEPSSFDISTDLDEIEAFTNFVSHDACYFSLDAMDSSGAYLATMHFSGMYTNGTDSTCLNISDCDQPMSLSCEADDNIATWDILSAFVKDMLMHKPYDYAYPATASPYFTGALLEQLTYPITPIANTYAVDTLSTPRTESWTISLDSTCNIELNLEMTSGNSYQFKGIRSIVATAVDGDPDEDGLYHDFYVVCDFRRWPTGFTRDTIFGNTCIGFKPCSNCVDTAQYPDIVYNDTTEADDGDGMFLSVPDMPDDHGSIGSIPSEYKKDVASYFSYRKTIALYNKEHTARAEKLPVIDLAAYRKTNMRKRLTGYKKYLDDLATANASNRRIDKDQPAIGLAQWVLLNPAEDGFTGGMMLRLVEADSSEFVNDCDSLYDVYLEAVTRYNDSASANGWTMISAGNIYDSLEFDTASFCYCAQSYASLLNSASDHLISTASPFGTTINNPYTYCNGLLMTPCAPNNGPIDTIQNIPFTYVNPCVQYQLEMAVVNATNAYNQYIDSLTTYISNKYTQHCLGALETFTHEYTDKEYHFTLYYYDQAGSLVKTVPPQGVQLLNITSPSSADEVKCIADRTYGTQQVFTSHVLATRYEYNSLNQLVKQNMPDHDAMNLWETKLPDGLDSNLTVTSVQFIDGSQGYLTGTVPGGYTATRGVLYKTNDAGETWQKINLAATDFRKIQMVDSLYGYAVGTNGVAFITQDGGTTWDVLSNYHCNTPNTTPVYVFDDVVDLHFINRTQGILATKRNGYVRVDPALASGSVPNSGYSRITPAALTSPDYSTSVNYDAALTSYFYTVNDFDAVTGLTYNTNLRLTTPSGSAASVISTLTSHDIKNVSWIDTSSVKGFACGTDGSLLYTGDRGVTWIYRPVNVAGTFKQVYFRDADNGVAIIEDAGGIGYVCATHDNGLNWTTLSDSARDYNAMSPYEVSSTGAKLVAVGQDGVVSRVLAIDGTDYGIIDLDKPNSTVDLTTCFGTVIAGKTWIYTGGNTNKLYRTKDAGASTVTWTSQNITCISQFKK